MVSRQFLLCAAVPTGVVLLVLLMQLHAQYHGNDTNSNNLLHRQQQQQRHQQQQQQEEQDKKLAVLKDRVQELTKQLAQARDEARRDNGRGSPVPLTPPAAPQAGSVVRVVAAALYCNCPALVNGGNASQVLQRMRAHAFYRSFPRLPGDVNGCIDLTESVGNQCSGKQTCDYQIEHAPPVLGCPAKVAVEFVCGETGRSAVHYNVRRHQTVRLDCTEPPPPPSSPSVNHIVPVLAAIPGVGPSLIWPVGFSLPAHRFQRSVSWKDTDFAELIPGNRSTYHHKHEKGRTKEERDPDTSYFMDYRRSYFGVTRKKKGWDCLRHYEIIAAGSVPYFLDLPRLPASTMAFFPRDLVWEAMNLPGVSFREEMRSLWNREAFSIDHNVFDKKRYFDLAARIQEHARKHLTSEAMAQYIMQALTASGGPKNPKKVLFIHHCYHDFMGDSLWSGFKELEAEGALDKVTDVVPPPEKSTTEGWKKYWGYGKCVEGRKLPLVASAETLDREAYYSYANGWGNHRSLNFDSRPPEVNIPQRILAKEFDVVIYAAPSRTLAWLTEVSRVYSKTAVAFVIGDDNPELLNTYARFVQRGILFVREMYDEGGGGYVVENTCHDAAGIADTQGLDCCAEEGTGGKVVWSSPSEDTSLWQQCGSEGGQCSCDGPAARFGDPIGHRWSVLALDSARTVKCNNLNSGGPFPDPAVGHAKVCQCRKKT